MRYIMNKLKSEDGNMTILSISVMAFGLLMIVLFLNFTKFFAVFDRANTSAEQASLAATSVVYEEAMEVISTYEYKCGETEDGDPIYCPLRDVFNNVKNSVQASNPSYTTNQINREAINQLLISWLPREADLSRILRSKLISSGSRIQQVVREVITENKGKVTGTEIRYFNNDNRIEVLTTAELEINDAGFIPSLNYDIPNIGLGVEVPFIEMLGWSDRSYVLY